MEDLINKLEFRSQQSTVFSKQIIRKLAQQLTVWSALVMLLVQPLSLQAFDCGCCRSDANPVASTKCCSKTQATKSCCTNQVADCCSAKNSCCSESRDVTPTKCKCGDNCQCAAKNRPLQPAPVVPLNDSAHDQTQLLLLSIEPSPNISSLLGGPSTLPSGQICKPSFSARQVCALLSRFIC